MAKSQDNFWSKHTTGIIQCVLSFYCAALATWEYYHPLQAAGPVVGSPVPQNSTGVPMNAGYSMPFWLWAGIVALALSVAIPAIVNMLRKRWPARTSQSLDQQAASLQPAGRVTPGIPSLSALLGQNPNVYFDSKKFFALAHYSPITAEIESNIKIAAEQASPGDKEAFYARFIGVGLVAYQHDVTWFTIFGSQLSAMAEMNRRGSIPIADVRSHYDKAVMDFPKTYAQYSLDQWINYMLERLLIVRYPSEMIELSFNGKDFLRYLAHTARDANGKPN